MFKGLVNLPKLIKICFKVCISRLKNLSTFFSNPFPSLPFSNFIPKINTISHTSFADPAAQISNSYATRILSKFTFFEFRIFSSIFALSKCAIFLPDSTLFDTGKGFAPEVGRGSSFVEGNKCTRKGA